VLDIAIRSVYVTKWWQRWDCFVR